MNWFARGRSDGTRSAAAAAARRSGAAEALEVSCGPFVARRNANTAAAAAAVVRIAARKVRGRRWAAALDSATRIAAASWPSNRTRTGGRTPSGCNFGPPFQSLRRLGQRAQRPADARPGGLLADSEQPRDVAVGTLFHDPQRQSVALRLG